MYKICQTEQSYRRQRELENGLLQMMQHKNYEDISVSDLCEYLQIPRKSFYRYFSSKDGALYALIDHTLADFFQMPLPEMKTRGNASGELELFFDFWYENRSLLDALQRSSLSGILMQRTTSFALQGGHMPQKFKAVPAKLQGVALSFAVCGLLAMVLNWHHQGFDVSPEDMTRLAINMLTTPLVNS